METDEMVILTGLLCALFGLLFIIAMVVTAYRDSRHRNYFQGGNDWENLDGIE